MSKRASWTPNEREAIERFYQAVNARFDVIYKRRPTATGEFKGEFSTKFVSLVMALRETWNQVKQSSNGGV